MKQALSSEESQAPRCGFFKKHGLTLDVLFTQGGPESVQGVIGGSIQVATAVGTSAALGTFAKGAPIRLIGSEMIGAPELYWYVRADSPVHRIADFNGRTIAYSLTGSSSHAAVLAHELRRSGLSVELVEAKLKRAMELANKLGARFVLIVGENELAAGRYTFKNMVSGEQENLTREEIAARLRAAAD